MGKSPFLMAAMAAALSISVSTGAQAANTPTAGNGAAVTRAALASSFSDGTTIYPATCQETQVINTNQRNETFQCRFDGAVPAPIVCDTSSGCFWFSDFDGAGATDTHFVITPSGRLVGWATY